MENIDDLRKEINDIDDRLIALFEKRMETAIKIAAYKKENGLPVLDASREKEVLRRNLTKVQNQNLLQETEAFLINLMDISKKVQEKVMSVIEVAAKKIKIGYYGISGSFSEQAASQYFGEEADAHAVSEFEDVFLELKYGKIEYGVLPIENSSTGAIDEVYDLLHKYDFHIVGELCLKINQHLMGVRGAGLDDIKVVYSHPQALEQCKEFLKGYPEWRRVPFGSTAKSAELVSTSGDKSLAAIGSSKAAKLYDLEVLQKNINSNLSNATRFVVIGREMECKNLSNKVSLMLSTTHKAGSLYNVLRYFAENKINLLKIESRPIKDKPWEYFFYIDFEGNLQDDKIKTAVSLVKENSHYFKVIGNYIGSAENIELR